MKDRDDLGKLALRVLIGGLMLFHGIAKLKGVSGIESMLANKGLPGFIAYGVYVGEIIAPLLIIAGTFTRMAALVFAFNMAVAVLLTHPGDVFALAKHGGWKVELQVLFAGGAIIIFLMGPGRYALGKGRGWRA